ncbi:MAG: HemK/PrmC family methyltransferase [Acidimicrobiales bacterium]|jgi:release factor glutamine methyltransferase
MAPEAESRWRLVESIAVQLGSTREARWIVDYAGTELAQAMADRRGAGEPLQYVLGSWPFRTVELQVDPRVLIPRPETEYMVGVALGELDRICRGSGIGEPASGPPTGPRGPGTRRIGVDLGTGSGAIALSLAVEGKTRCPNLDVWATDASTDALDVARANLESLDRVDPEAAGRVRLAHGSWFDALPVGLVGRVDLLVSNPPYVTESEYPDLDPSVREWEPREALVASSGALGAEGMAAIEAIVSGAPRWLARSGAVVIEIAPMLAGASVAAARRAGFTHVVIERDLAGRPRVLVARW